MMCVEQKADELMCHLFQGDVLVFQLHHMFDLLLLVLVAQQMSVSVRQLV